MVGQIVADAGWLADRLPGSQGPVGVGVSIPGTVRRRDGFVEHAPNLNWRAVPFAALLADRLPGRLDVQVGNDADLGAVAEHQRGAAVGYDHLVYLNGSVGVGSGIIAEGSQLHGVGGYAGEIGHMTVNPDGPPCHCGSTGCIETYIGEHALLRAAGVTDQHGPQAVAAVFEAAAAGERRAVAAVHTVAIWLGRCLANVVNCFNPQAIVVGGSLAEVVRLDRAVGGGRAGPAGDGRRPGRRAGAAAGAGPGLGADRRRRAGVSEPCWPRRTRWSPHSPRPEPAGYRLA